MKRVLITMLWFFVAAAALAATTRPSDSDVKWGKPVDGCRIGLKRFPTTAAGGNPIDGTVVIENVGAGEILFLDELGFSEGAFRIEASINDYDAVRPTSYSSQVRGGSQIMDKIGPSERLEIPLRLSRLIDMSRSGEYSVTLGFSVYHSRTASAPASTEGVNEAKSPQMYISVR
jgi:hypothetical protein